MPNPSVGHTGDGNFHLSYLLNPNDPVECATAERLCAQMVQRAIRLEGTCTGEHGIGLHKMGYLIEEAGGEQVNGRLQQDFGTPESLPWRVCDGFVLTTV